MAGTPLSETTRANAWMALGVLSVVNLFNFMDRILFSVLLEPIKVDLALSDSEMGILAGIAFGAFYGLMGLVMGRLADTRSRVATLSGALALWSSAAALTGQASTFTQMFLARGAVGSGVSASSPCAHSLIGDYFPAEKRALAISLFTCIGTAGTMVGLILGGAVLNLYGWRITFAVFGLTGVAFAPIVYLLLPEPPRTLAAQARPARWSETVRGLLARPTVRALIVGMPLVMSAGGIATWIPAYLQRAFGSGSTTMGGLSLGLGLLIGTLAGGIIVNALRKRDSRWEFWWPALSTALSAPLLAGFYLADTAPLAYALLFAAFFVAGSAFGPALSCMLVVSEPGVRGTMVALNVLATSLIAYGLTPGLIGLISDHMISFGFQETNGASLRVALIAALAIPLAGAVAFLVASRTSRADAVE